MKGDHIKSTGSPLEGLVFRNSRQRWSFGL